VKAYIRGPSRNNIEDEILRKSFLRPVAEIQESLSIETSGSPACPSLKGLPVSLHALSPATYVRGLTNGCRRYPTASIHDLFRGLIATHPNDATPENSMLTDRPTLRGTRFFPAHQSVATTFPVSCHPSKRANSATKEARPLVTSNVQRFFGSKMVTSP